MTTAVARLGMTYHISEAGIGVIGFDLRTETLRVQEESRHGSLGLVGIL
jgi:hypothetical protein